MKHNDLVIMQKTLQKVIEHEKAMLKFRELDIFNFVPLTREHSLKVDETLIDIDKEINVLKENEKKLKSDWIPNKLENMKKVMTKEVVDAVNQINGGPVTEYKVFKMLEMERHSNVKDDIETMEKKIMSFLDADVFTKIERTDKGLSETNAFMHNMNVFVKEHEKKFEHELTEPNRLTPEEEVA